MNTLPLEPYDISEIPKFHDSLFYLAVGLVLFATLFFVYKFFWRKETDRQLSTLSRFAQVRLEAQELLQKNDLTKEDLALLLVKIRRIDTPIGPEIVRTIESSVFARASTPSEVKDAIFQLIESLQGK